MSIDRINLLDYSSLIEESVHFATSSQEFREKGSREKGMWEAHD